MQPVTIRKCRESPGIPGREPNAALPLNGLHYQAQPTFNPGKDMIDIFKALILTITVTSSLLIAGCGQEQKVHESWKTPPPRETVDDSTLNSEIKSALQADPEVRHLDIRVEAHAGTVMLSGFAENEAQMDRINMLAWMVDGVRKVDNKIDVRGGVPATDGREP